MQQVTHRNKKIMFAVQCRQSRLFLCDFTPARAAIQITPVASQAHQFKGRAEASQFAKALRPLFGSFDFHAVMVEG